MDIECWNLLQFMHNGRKFVAAVCGYDLMRCLRSMYVGVTRFATNDICHFFYDFISTLEILIICILRCLIYLLLTFIAIVVCSFEFLFVCAFTFFLHFKLNITNK